MSKINNDAPEWSIVINSKHKLLDLNLGSLWQFRDLLFILVKRDFISFYKQTILGPIWFFVQPLFTTVTYIVIFGNIANVGTDGLPQGLFYLSGITMWNYFSDSLLKTSTVFRDNSNIFSKVYFPRLIIPLSIILSNLIKLGVQFILFLVLLFYYYKYQGFEINLDIYRVIFLFPMLILLMAFLGLSLGLIISALTTKYRDLSFLVNFGIQLMMYTTTVIYPLSITPSRLKKIISFNPMTGIIESFRNIFLGRGEMSFETLGYSIIFTIISLILGLIIFNKVEKNFIDTI
jgi:lipopolysaccharide transport system permease protein